MNPTIAAQIRTNNRTVWLMMVALTVVIGVLGALISRTFDWGLTGTGAFFLVAGVIDLVAYYFSHAIVLRIARARPLDRSEIPELYELVTRLCSKAQIPVPKLYLLDETTMNAFATGRDHAHSAVAVTRGLLQRLTSEEVEAVVAHELSHIQTYDMRTMAVVSLLAGCLSILADLFWSSNLGSKAQERDSSGLVLGLGMVLAIFAPLSAFLIQQAISRKREYVADAGSAALTGRPRALASALRKLSMDVRLPKHWSVSTAHLYLSSPAPDTLIERLFSTHPSLHDRIRVLEGL